MIGREHVRTMAAYNRWMNERLYAVCADIPDAERKRDAGAFFKTIHGTLNHLLLGDRVWLGRFTAKPFVVKALSQELYADFGELARERAATDAAIDAWADALTEQQLASELVFTSFVSPGERRLPFWLAVTHLFNHQTHHRGQLTTLLSQRGIDPGVTDLIALPRA